ncbi:hypothetical protein SRHO_G00266330 [Serrasalmus rhombeus]
MKRFSRENQGALPTPPPTQSLRQSSSRSWSRLVRSSACQIQPSTPLYELTAFPSFFISNMTELAWNQQGPDSFKPCQNTSQPQPHTRAGPGSPPADTQPGDDGTCCL